MKKNKIFLVISIVLLSLFINTNKVNAKAKELACAYQKQDEGLLFFKKKDVARMLIQTSDGKLLLYTNKNDANINGTGWELLDELPKDNIKYVKKPDADAVTLKDNLTSCPEVIEPQTTPLAKAKKFIFYKSKKNSLNQLVSYRVLTSYETDFSKITSVPIQGYDSNKNENTKNDKEAENSNKSNESNSNETKSLTCVYFFGTDKVKRALIQTDNGVMYFENSNKPSLADAAAQKEIREQKGEELEISLSDKNWKSFGKLDFKNVKIYGGNSSQKKSDIGYIDSNNKLTKCPGGIDGTYSALKLYGNGNDSYGKRNTNIEELEIQYNAAQNIADVYKELAVENTDTNEETRICYYRINKGKIKTLAVVRNSSGKTSAWKNSEKSDSITKFTEGSKKWELISSDTKIKKLPANIANIVECPSGIKMEDNKIVACESDKDKNCTPLYDADIDSESVTPKGFEAFEEFKVNYKFVDDEVNEIKTCEDLFGNNSGLLDMLKTGVIIFRIFIPILLIVLGVKDFGMAVLAQEEDKMKQAQTKFIKRLIIGIVIFIIPSALKVILNIANTVWGETFIDSSFCGIL